MMFDIYSKKLCCHTQFQDRYIIGHKWLYYLHLVERDLISSAKLIPIDHTGST